MKKLFACILLLSHINSSVFFQSADETDVYDKKGRQIDDINSLAEYIDQVILENHDSTPEDEDDDQAEYFQVSQINTYNFEPYRIQIEPLKKEDKKNYSNFLTENKFTSPVFEIPCPPPEIC